MWNNASQAFLSKNKYRGRELKTSDFSCVLGNFLHDGETLLVDHIPVLIQKLHNLAAILLQLDGFRFYGCSLLLIYDGDKEVQNHYSRRARIPAETKREEVDEFAEHRHRPETASRPRRPSDSLGRRSKSVDVPSHQPADAVNVRRTRGEVNVRVVDFAHTTTGQDFVPFPPEMKEKDSTALGKGYDTPIDSQTGLAMARFPPKHPTTPDMGFIFGIRSVCRALTEIWEGEMMERGEGERGLEIRENSGVFESAFGDEWDEGELSS